MDLTKNMTKIDLTKTMKTAAAGTAIVGTFGLGIMAFGSGLAGAKPGNPHPNPPGPGVAGPQHPGNGNGHNNGNGNSNANRNANGSDYDDGADYGDDDGADYGDDDGAWDGGNIDAIWLPGDPPGHNPFGPPGQVKKMPTLTIPTAIDLGEGNVIPAGTIFNPNPFLGIPPGQWGDIDLLAIDPTDISWIPEGSGLTEALPLEWNVEAGAWGVAVNGVFTPYPFPLPIPTS